MTMKVNYKRNFLSVNAKVGKKNVVKKSIRLALPDEKNIVEMGLIIPVVHWGKYDGKNALIYDTLEFIDNGFSEMLETGKIPDHCVLSTQDLEVIDAIPSLFKDAPYPEIFEGVTLYKWFRNQFRVSGHFVRRGLYRLIIDGVAYSGTSAIWSKLLEKIEGLFADDPETVVITDGLKDTELMFTNDVINLPYTTVVDGKPYIRQEKVVDYGKKFFDGEPVTLKTMILKKQNPVVLFEGTMAANRHSEREFHFEVRRLVELEFKAKHPEDTEDNRHIKLSYMKDGKMVWNWMPSELNYYGMVNEVPLKLPYVHPNLEFALIRNDKTKEVVKIIYRSKGFAAGDKFVMGLDGGKGVVGYLVDMPEGFEDVDAIMSEAGSMKWPAHTPVISSGKMKLFGSEVEYEIREQRLTLTELGRFTYKNYDGVVSGRHLIHLGAMGMFNEINRVMKRQKRRMTDIMEFSFDNSLNIKKVDVEKVMKLKDMEEDEQIDALLELEDKLIIIQDDDWNETGRFAYIPKGWLVIETQVGSLIPTQLGHAFIEQNWDVAGIEWLKMLSSIIGPSGGISSNGIKVFVGKAMLFNSQLVGLPEKTLVVPDYIVLADNPSIGRSPILDLGAVVGVHKYLWAEVKDKFEAVFGPMNPPDSDGAYISEGLMTINHGDGDGDRLAVADIDPIDDKIATKATELFYKEEGELKHIASFRDEMEGKNILGEVFDNLLMRKTLPKHTFGAMSLGAYSADCRNRELIKMYNSKTPEEYLESLEELTEYAYKTEKLGAKQKTKHVADAVTDDMIENGLEVINLNDHLPKEYVFLINFGYGHFDTTDPQVFINKFRTALSIVALDDNLLAKFLVAIYAL